MSEETTIDDGGPAFPTIISKDTPMQWLPNGSLRPVSGGMSLRDWFAGRALEYDIHESCVLYEKTHGNYPTRIQARYLFADAMIAQRKR